MAAVAGYRICPHCTEGVGNIRDSTQKGTRRRRLYRCSKCGRRWEVLIREEIIEIVVRYKTTEVR